MIRCAFDTPFIRCFNSLKMKSFNIFQGVEQIWKRYFNTPGDVFPFGTSGNCGLRNLSRLLRLRTGFVLDKRHFQRTNYRYDQVSNRSQQWSLWTRCSELLRNRVVRLLQLHNNRSYSGKKSVSKNMTS